MPLYVYEITRRDGKPGKQFEVMQKLSEATLQKHPETGEPVHRVYSAPSTPRNRYEKAVKQISKEK